MRVVVVPTRDVKLLWAEAAPLLQLAMDEAHGETDIETVKASILAEEQILFVCLDSGFMVAAVTMEIRDFPTKKVIFITLAGGSLMDEWFEEVVNQAEKLAKLERATAVYISGRRGWARQLREIGFREYFTTIGREVTL
jgi:hypothetical protein